MPCEWQDKYAVEDIFGVTYMIYIYQLLHTTTNSTHIAALAYNNIPCIHYQMLFSLLAGCCRIAYIPSTINTRSIIDLKLHPHTPTSPTKHCRTVLHNRHVWRTIEGVTGTNFALQTI